MACNEPPPVTTCSVRTNMEFSNAQQRKFSDLRARGLLIDFTLHVGKKSFPVHRLILASGSPVLEAMLTTDMAEAQTGEAKLDHLNPDVIAKLVDYMYTGNLTFTIEEAEEVLEAAEFLQVKEICKRSGEFIINNISAKNCFRWFHVGDKFNLEDIKDKAKKVIHSRFEDIVREEEFKTMSLSEVLDLVSDKKIAKDEDLMLEACMVWIEFGVKARKQHIAALVDAIDLRRCTEKHLRYICKQYKDILSHDTAAENKVLRACVESCTVLDVSRIGSLTKAPNKVIISGGHSTKIWSLESINGESQLTEIIGKERPDIWQLSSLCDIDNGYFLVIGGHSNPNHRSNLCTAYSFESDTWKLRAPMPTARYCSTSVQVQNDVYVLGGELTPRASEVYSLSSNQWSSIPAPPSNLSYPAVANIHNVIYCWDMGTEASILKYDILTKAWSTFIKPADIRIQYATAATCDGLFYILGGPAHVCVAFNPASHMWSTQLAKPAKPHYNGSAVCCGHKLYLIGGRCTDIEVYDVRRNTWTMSSAKMMDVLSQLKSACV